ncbi:hydrogenase large subunit [Tsukamurella soli]|uniref:Hydrogenase large subunit n=1 Tax=Tsukamurella soli TaxID=644556 RepID=A0ABP8JML9_9ACTN
MSVAPIAGAGTVVRDVTVAEWHDALVACAATARFAGLYGTHEGTDIRLRALFVGRDGVVLCVGTVFEGGGDDGSGDDGSEGDGAGRAYPAPSYPSVTHAIPAAVWYERALHDLSGVVAVGHPRLDPLLSPLDSGSFSPQPGRSRADGPGPIIAPAPDRRGPSDLEGDGVFTLPLGPVRSGVYESIEFLIETPGEDIPHLNIRPHYKHRGVATRFDGCSPDDGIVVAERVEGIASVAHALAFSHAVEALAGVDVPARAAVIRVLHAELERIANHLDVAMRLCEAAGLSVAYTRFGWHKEETMRTVSTLCGNRFGRGVVCPGGVTRNPDPGPAQIAERVARLHDRVRADRDELMANASFLDRLRGTGVLHRDVAHRYGAVGPVGRGSAVETDVRWDRPYDAYRDLRFPQPPVAATGDCLARLRVRWREIDVSARLIADACEMLDDLGATPLAAQARPADGYSTGAAEAPQGEVLYGLEIRGGRIARCFARSASLHDMVLFHEVFSGDVFTDFAFIEATFGLSYAGVAM